MSQAFFRLKAPCGECPFRKDIHPYLRRDRVREITDALLKQDRSFACHKTISTGNKRPSPEGDAFCAGALIFLEKADSPNRLPRLGRAFGWYDPDALKQRDLIYDSAEDMIAAI